MNDILKFAIDNGIIDLSYVQEKMEMNKRKELLEKHPWKIFQGSDGKWRTYLPGKEGRKMLKRSTKESIENEVIAYWRAEEENPTIADVFQEWSDRRLELKKISDATHMRNQQIFNRHYKDFGKKRIKTVDPEDIEEFLEEQIPKFDLTAKAFSNLKSVTRGFLKRAKKRKLINWNVEEIFTELDVSDHDFKRTRRADENDVFTEDEFPVIMNYLENHLDNINIGILLLFVTGIRVGELVALKHEDFSKNSFRVQRTETRYCLQKGKYEYKVNDFPKTEAGIRTVVIPKHYSWIVREINLMNPFGEYVFVAESGKRMITPAIRNRLYQICDHLGMKRKSPHKVRKTYGSILLDNSIDNRLIISLMGHTDISCTENFYHKNRRSIEKKVEIISRLPEFGYTD